MTLKIINLHNSLSLQLPSKIMQKSHMYVNKGYYNNLYSKLLKNRYKPSRPLKIINNIKMAISDRISLKHIILR